MNSQGYKTYSKYAYPAVAAFFMLALAYTLFVKFDIRNLVLDLSALAIDRKYSFLFLAIVLLGFNWSLEAQKWKLAMREYVAVDFGTCFQSVMVGVAAGIFTPAKVGEYAGRMLLIGDEYKATSVLSTLLNSMAQMTVTVVIGLIAVMGFAYKLQFLDLNLMLLYLGAFVMFAAITVSYLMLPELTNYLAKYKFFSRHLIQIKGQKISKTLLTVLLQLSFLRYAVYTTQYLFVFYFFGVEHCWVELTGYIAIVFLIQTLMPLPPIAAFVGRGGIALIVFSSLGINELVILAATLLIWVINLLIPALVGLALATRYKVKSIV